MKAEDRQKIDELIGRSECPKHFKCAESGFQELCKAVDVGHKDLLVCLEGQAGACHFSVPRGQEFLCRCPIRVYIAKHEAQLPPD